MTTTMVRYDELKAGDKILWSGAKEFVKWVKHSVIPASEKLVKEAFPDEIDVTFELEPADFEAVELLGNFYSRGIYGGVGCLRAQLILD